MCISAGGERERPVWPVCVFDKETEMKELLIITLFLKELMQNSQLLNGSHPLGTNVKQMDIPKN